MGRTTVIAEVGPNHNGDWELAREMIEAAAGAGADYVKFQLYREDQVNHPDEREWYGKVQVPDDVHLELRDHAEAAGIRFLSTPFTEERARFLVEDVGLSEIKVASSELTNVDLLEYLDAAAETVFLSTGLATLEEVEGAVRYLDNVEDLCVMQCTSEYPCPPTRANLAVIDTYRETFPNCRIGFSDHTLGNLAAEVAVALGAEVVEKHFTSDRTLSGPDQQLSVTPAELQEFSARAEGIAELLGTGKKRPTDAECEVVDRFRTRFSSNPTKRHR
jgi:sialic acid synthase SpsE